tara:strand:- start:6 stop:257 length:252 start_codon:yes stop_codon:yes gene_type:complete
MAEYTFGNGKVAVGSGYNKITEIPCIEFSKLNDGFKIGTDILNKNFEKTEKTIIYFKNLESLAVLETAIKKVKKLLKEQNKLK